MNETIKYKYTTNKVVEIKNFKKPNQEFFFEVNLPACEKSFHKGFGERVWAYTDLSSYNKIKNNHNGEIIYVKLLSDSFYYKDLKHETLIPIELRGEYRPVAIYEELSAKYQKNI